MRMRSPGVVFSFKKTGRSVSGALNSSGLRAAGAGGLRGAGRLRGGGAAGPAGPYDAGALPFTQKVPILCNDHPPPVVLRVILRVIWGVGIDSDSPFTRQINGFNGITVISGLLAGAECAISAAIAPRCLTACSVTYHRRVCLIDTYTTHFCSLALHRSMSNYPFDAHNACSNKTRNCTSKCAP